MANKKSLMQLLATKLDSKMKECVATHTDKAVCKTHQDAYALEHKSLLGKIRNDEDVEVEIANW